MKKLFLAGLLFLLGTSLQAQVRFEKTVDTINDLQNLQPDDIHNVVFVKGYASALAGDGAEFIYDSTSATATNTVSVFKPTSVSGNGRWLRRDPTFQAGSTTVPSITFGLDSNTGFANSAADQIDILTGGTRRGYVDSAGSLRLTAGVASSSTTTGTAIITGGLGVSGAANIGGVTATTDTTEATTGGAAALKSSGGIYAAKKIVGATDLIINTSLLYADSAASKLGVGTTGPDKKLDVLDTTGLQYRATYTDGTVYSDWGTLSTGATFSTNSLGHRTTSTIVNDTAVNARHVQGGLAFDGNTASYVSYSTAIVSAIRKTQPFSYSTTFSAVDLNDTRTLFYIAETSTTEFRIALKSSYLCVGYYDGALGSYIVDKQISTAAIEAGKLYNLVVTWDGSSLVSYLNGVAQTQSGAPSISINSATVVQLGYYSGAATQWNGSIFSATLFNRALTAAEVVTLANQGVQEADKWGSLTAARTYDWSAGVDGWVANDPAVTTVARDAGPTVGVSNNLSVTDTGVAGNHLARSADSPIVIGKKYRLTYSYYWPVANSANYSSFRVWYRDASATIESVSPIKDGAWHTRTVDFTATSTVGPAFYIYNASNTFNFTGTVGDVAYFNAVSLTKIGSILDADLSAGVGYQVPDRSSNKYHGTVSTTGTAWTLANRRGQVRATTNTSGNQQILGQSCLPTTAIIKSIIGYTTGTPTIYIGNVSAGNQHVTATAMSASTYTDFTVATKSTTGNVWVNSTTADTINWVIDYILGDY